MIHLRKIFTVLVTLIYVCQRFEWKTLEYTQETQSPGEGEIISVAKEFFIDNAIKEVGVGM